MRRPLIASCLLACLNAPCAAADAARGKDIALQHCVRCHVVDPANRHAGISSTPSFMTIVDALPDWKERFETFYARRPHPVHVRIEGLPAPDETIVPSNATPFTLTLDDVGNIAAYAQQLKGAMAQ